MKLYQVKTNDHFVGRQKELSIIADLHKKDEAQILICYGRRRVGKTELIEQAFRKTKLLKFEGLKGKNQPEEIKHFLSQLSDYAEEPIYRELPFTTWKQCFELLAKKTAKGAWTIYFEELQWMACYSSDLVADLKYVWDNFFKKNPQLRLILCGSATSFMLTQVVRSQVLYNRSQTIIELKEFSLAETYEFLGKKHSLPELMDIYLSLGGIPEYLKQIQKGASLYIKMCQQSFVKNGFFQSEIDRIFVSNLSDREHYRKIVEILSQKKFLTREQILAKLDVQSGGKISELIQDLTICRFISANAPIGKSENSKLQRYQVSDSYLRFYYKFINPQKSAIERGQFDRTPIKGLNNATWRKWLGFAFEHWCMENSVLIAEILSFADVQYKVGPYFNRSTNQLNPGFQIDLMFDRSDRVVSVCEIKYTDNPVGSEVIKEFSKKIDLLNLSPRKTLQKILITAAGAKPELSGYFDRIITLDQLFKNSNNSNN